MRTSRRMVIAAGALMAAGPVLSGCSSNTADEGVVTVARLSGDDEIWNAVAEEFTAAHPDYTVEYTIIPSDSYDQQISTRLTAGTAPDVLNVFPGMGGPTSMASLQEAGYLADLSDEAWVAEVPETVTPLTTVDGSTYMFTDFGASNSIGGIYNTDLLEELGLEIPDTYSGLLEYCDEVQAAGKIPFALGAQTQWVTQLVTYALVATNVYADNPDFDDKQLAGEATFGDSGWQRSLDQYKEMFDRGCFNSDALGTSVDNAEALVNDGRAVGIIQLTTIARNIGEANDFQIALAPLPATDDPTQTHLALGLGVGWGVNAKAQNEVGARAFVEFLTTPEVAALSANPYGLAPEGEIEETPINTLQMPLVASERTVPFMDTRWPSPRVQAAHFTGVQELLGGNTTSEDVLAEMQAEYDEGLE